MPVLVAELVDQNELLHTYLKTLAPIVSATSGRIYGPPGLPDGWTPVVGKTLVFMNGEFTGDASVPKTENQYRFLCYGFDEVDARSLYRVLYGNLHRVHRKTVAITGGNGLLIYAKQNTGPYSATDPSSGWCWNWGMWEIHMAENFV